MSTTAIQPPDVQGLTLRLPFRLWQLVRDSARRNEHTVTREIILACRAWLWIQRDSPGFAQRVAFVKDEQLAHDTHQVPTFELDQR